MEILIWIILYLLAIVLAMMLGDIFKKSDNSTTEEIEMNENKNQNRRHYLVHDLFKD